MVEAVILDVDGTLVDSVDLHARCWRGALRHFGKDISFEDVRSQIGKGGDQLIPKFLDEHEQQAFGDELDDYRSRLWKRSYMDRVRAFPKSRELVERMLAEGKKVVLASSAKGDELEHYKKITGITDLIHAETSADDADRSKPHPDIFHAALDTLGNPPGDRVMVVGDTPWDVIAAKRAGLRTIAVLTGAWEADALRQSGAFAVYQDLEDILRRWEESPFRMLAMYEHGTPLAEWAP